MTTPEQPAAGLEEGLKYLVQAVLESVDADPEDEALAQQRFEHAQGLVRQLLTAKVNGEPMIVAALVVNATDATALILALVDAADFIFKIMLCSALGSPTAATDPSVYPQVWAELVERLTGYNDFVNNLRSEQSPEDVIQAITNAMTSIAPEDASGLDAS